MASFTLNAPAALETVIRSGSRRDFFLRAISDRLGKIGVAMMASRQRRADIEIRRVMALRGEPRERFDYALLPFAGE